MCHYRTLTLQWLHLKIGERDREEKDGKKEREIWRGETGKRTIGEETEERLRDQ
jgi:hypothetical protein